MRQETRTDSIQSPSAWVWQRKPYNGSTEIAENILVETKETMQ
jgi:hypothetical protein